VPYISLPRARLSPKQTAMTLPKTVTLLGATGSIGQTATALLLQHRARFQVAAVVGSKNAQRLAQHARELNASMAVVADEAAYTELKDCLSGTGIKVGAGEAAVLEAASVPADIIVSAIVGAAGLKPTLKALEQGTRVALANKESLVCAGNLLLETARKHGTEILPVDSEHNAIFQIFTEPQRAALEHITLTASGGPFREYTLEALQTVTPEQATNHPIWAMGQKISVDSATLMNKGLEVIEACYLFDLPEDRVNVLVHPQSIVHGLAHYADGSVLAQLGMPDMTIPISYALGYPERLANTAKRLDLSAVGQLSFRQVDDALFPCLSLARQAYRTGGIAPTVLNAANEIAVQAFLDKKIAFLSIAKIIAATLETIPPCGVYSLDDVLQADAAARRVAMEKLRR
jgi:1-deoxy-D-xylulose-5-phosphate reductoisomerase